MGVNGKIGGILDYLAQSIARGDEKAFAELYEKTRKIVYSVCLSVVKNRAVAEELTQETFVTVWRQISVFRGKGLKTWVLTIARNKSLNELRRIKREIATDFSEEESVFQSYAYTVDSGIEMGALLSAALDKLDLTDRQIVLLKNSGMKTKEIAAFLEMPRGTVSWRYSQALQILKDYMEERE